MDLLKSERQTTETRRKERRVEKEEKMERDQLKARKGTRVGERYR
jgi:hypothetical protein